MFFRGIVGTRRYEMHLTLKDYNFSVNIFSAPFHLANQKTPCTDAEEGLTATHAELQTHAALARSRLSASVSLSSRYSGGPTDALTQSGVRLRPWPVGSAARLEPQWLESARLDSVDCQLTNQNDMQRGQ